MPCVTGCLRGDCSLGDLVAFEPGEFDIIVPKSGGVECKIRLPHDRWLEIVGRVEPYVTSWRYRATYKWGGAFTPGIYTRGLAMITLSLGYTTTREEHSGLPVCNIVGVSPAEYGADLIRLAMNVEAGKVKPQIRGMGC